MRVLLTGHNGYIGSVMSAELQKAGYEVVGLDTDYFENCTLGCPNRILYIRKDIRDVSVSDLKGFDAVIHLAALSNDPMAEIDVDLTYDINLFATLRLAEVAKFAGVHRFLYSSSCSVYGAGSMTEDGSIYPISAYAVSKVKSEEGLAKLADSHFSPVFLRNGTAYGFSPRLRTDLVLNTMVAHAYTTGIIRIMGDGSLWRPLVHVEDISQAFLLCLEAPKELIHNQIFNVGADEENYRIWEIANIVRETVPNTFLEKIDVEKDSRSYQVNFSKIAKFLGYEPKWNARAGAKQLYDKYKELGLTKEDLISGRFSRLSTLESLMVSGLLNKNLRWRENGKG